MFLGPFRNEMEEIKGLKIFQLLEIFEIIFFIKNFFNPSFIGSPLVVLEISSPLGIDWTGPRPPWLSSSLVLGEWGADKDVEGKVPFLTIYSFAQMWHIGKAW